MLLTSRPCPGWVTVTLQFMCPLNRARDVAKGWERKGGPCRTRKTLTNLAEWYRFLMFAKGFKRNWGNRWLLHPLQRERLVVWKFIRNDFCRAIALQKSICTICLADQSLPLRSINKPSNLSWIGIDYAGALTYVCFGTFGELSVRR